MWLFMHGQQTLLVHNVNKYNILIKNDKYNYTC